MRTLGTISLLFALSAAAQTVLYRGNFEDPSGPADSVSVAVSGPAGRLIYTNASSGGGSQVWTNDPGVTFANKPTWHPVDDTNILFVQTYDQLVLRYDSGQTVLGRGFLQMSPNSAGIPGVDFESYTNSFGVAVNYLSFGESLFGDCLTIDPQGDTSGFASPIPFSFSTTYSNTIAGGDILVAFANSHTNLATISGAGIMSLHGITITGTTNQIVFGGTNTAPVSIAAPTKWISVQVSGESAVYRLPLYQ